MVVVAMIRGLFVEQKIKQIVYVCKTTFWGISKDCFIDWIEQKFHLFVLCQDEVFGLATSLNFNCTITRSCN